MSSIFLANYTSESQTMRKNSQLDQSLCNEGWSMECYHLLLWRSHYPWSSTVFNGIISSLQQKFIGTRIKKCTDGEELNIPPPSFLQELRPIKIRSIPTTFLGNECQLKMNLYARSQKNRKEPTTLANLSSEAGFQTNSLLTSDEANKILPKS
jgi:hypothetical protein